MADFQIQSSQYKQATNQAQGLPSNQPAVVVSDSKADNKLNSQRELVSTNVVEQKAEPKAEPKQDTSAALHEKVAQMNDHMQSLNRNLQFTVDDRSGDSIVTVTDSETDKVIRQYPSEEILNARNSIAEQMKGTLIEAKV